MRSFSPRMLEVRNGSPIGLAPVAFSGRIDELTLEKWIAADPALAGERLLVLGRQLAEFAEDQDRLDILAVDEAGEIVLIELKVADNFRVTDLQALAYAGAYAARSTDELAGTLRHHLNKEAAVSTTADLKANGSIPGEPANAITVEAAKERIAEFLELDDFADWQPSQHVRIKLIAPSFPRRVLKNVKWLGDVYDMPIEAITVRLFEAQPGDYRLSFERVLPLPGEEEFDLTVRQREDRQRDENVLRKRRGAALPLLVNAGALAHGQTLYLAKTALTMELRRHHDPSEIGFQARVHAPGGTAPKLKWKATEDAEERILPPSAVAYHVYNELLRWDGDFFSSPVAVSFTIEPDGKTLEELALEHGVWEPA